MIRANGFFPLSQAKLREAFLRYWTVSARRTESFFSPKVSLLCLLEFFLRVVWAEKGGFLGGILFNYFLNADFNYELLEYVGDLFYFF